MIDRYVLTIHFEGPFKVRLISFHAMSDEDALGVASKFCTPLQHSVQVCPKDGPQPGRVYARWTWSENEGRPVRTDIAGSMEREP